MSVLIVGATLAALACISLVADSRLRRFARIPMKWERNGQVKWSAPRRIGLAFTPVLGAIVMPAALALPTDPGQGDSAMMLTLLAIALIGAHLLHMFMLSRWARNQAA